MRNSTLPIVETRFKDRFYCCLESLKGNYKFLLVFMMFMGSFMQGVSAQGTLVPSCNLIGPLEACAVADPNDTSGDFIINIEVARSGAPNLIDAQHNANFVYSFPSNSSGAFIRSYGNVVYNPVTNRTTQSLVVFPGSGTPEFNLQLNATNTSSVPSTVCECSKSVSVSKVAVTSSYQPILCYGQTTTLTAIGQFSDIGQYTYTLLPSGPTNTTGVFTGLAGSEAGITYIISCESAEGCIATTSQTITQPAYNPVVLNCPQSTTTAPCLSQEAVNTAFNTWLASFSSTGGTNSVITRSPSQPVAPQACGGSVTVTWSATERCSTQPVTCSSTFTVPTPATVVVNGPENSTSNACSYADQAAANAAFNAWLAGFSVSGGCTPVGNYGQPVAPNACGGQTTVTYNVTDKCYAGSSITRTFTITPAPAVSINGPQNSTSNACSYADQAAANAAFNAWLAGFTVSGGCSPVGSYGQPVAPLYCGGRTSVTYNVTDKCYQGGSITRTFEITPAPAVSINGPENSTTNACSYANQDAADAAFNAWLAGFTVSGGCSPVGSYGQPVAPTYCGGSTTVIYDVTDKCYQGNRISRTFTITPAPAVVATQSQNSTTSACSYANQEAANAAFSAWLAGFTVSGGCSPIGSFGEGIPQAPQYCGGQTTVNYTVSDKCIDNAVYTRTFTITPAPAVVANGPENSTTNACAYANQDAVNAAFNAWLTGFTVSGGCSPVGSYGQPVAPNVCGGQTTVTYNVSDKCYAGTSITRTFTITPAPAVVANGPENSNSNACSYANQEAANAAFNAWLAGFTVSGGCSPVGSYGQPVAPAACGGQTTVTYNVSDKCYAGTTITRTFTITPAPAVVVTQAQNSTTNACSYADQAAVNAAFNSWLAGFTVSGGCSPIGSFGEGQPSAPNACGGQTTVVYTVTDKCYELTRHTATFTITPAPAVVANGPENSTSSACSYADQAAVNAAFNAWLQGFTVSGGCSPVGSYGQPVAPAACGGQTTVTYNVSDKCYAGTTITRTFTITPAPAVVVTQAQDSTSSACAYANQDAANAAFNAWLAGFTVSGGCSPIGSFGETAPQAPNACGGQTTVVYTVTDKCYQLTRHTATFTITPAPAVVANGPENSTSNACAYANQDAVNAVFNAWLAGFTVSGGCSPVGSYGQPVAPNACGGQTTVTYNVSDKCYAGTTITRTFTITAAPAVVVNGPQDSTSNACSYADQAAANAAFNAWLQGFTVSGGCSPVGSYGQPVAPNACGGHTTVTYNVSDKCYPGSTITATFTITPAPAVMVNAPANDTTSSSAYADQAAANAAFNAWLAQFSVTGGCAPSANYGQPTPPPYCGGQTTVTYVVSDKCYEGSTIVRTFTITPANPANVGAPTDSTTNACSYADQAAANAAYNAWLAQFTVSGGINPVGSFGEGGAPQAPQYCGGTVTVTYTVTDRCHEPIVITRTFMITPAPAVVANGPQNSTSSACSYANQEAANAAFNAWLAGFTVSGGCAPVGVLSVVGSTQTTLTAPQYCGGSVTVAYTVSDKCYAGTTITSTFTITPAPAVNVTTAQDNRTSACIYANQEAANAAFNAWLAGFTVSGGCSPIGSFGETAPQAPTYCGGETTVTYTVSDKCYQGASYTATFSITPAPAVVANGPENSTSSACSYADQDAVNAAFNAWLAGFTVSGGCSPVGSYGQPVAPAACGGQTTVTYNVSDKCYAGTTITRTFTITPAPAVVVTQAQNSTTNACAYVNQDAVNAAFNSWLAGFTVSGGCSPVGSFGEGQPSAPNACGGQTTVVYTVTDKCYELTRHTATFTITPAPAVVANGPENSTSSACSYADQDAVNAAFNAWLQGFTVSGGCSPVGSYGQPVAPAACGGQTTVTYNVSDKCYAGTTITRTFTITPAPAVVVTQAQDSTSSACAYADQAAADAAFNAWLAGFTVSGGCSPVGSFGEGQPSAPNACGGQTTVVYTVTDKCYELTRHTATFTITPAPAVVANGPENSTSSACSYADQDAVNAAFNAWLQGFTVSGGCSPVGSYGQPVAPAACGGQTTVTYNVSDKCYAGTTITRTFTITPAPTVVVTQAQDSTTSACAYADQAAANAAFNAWLAGFTVSGGCSPVGSFGETAPQAPNACGGQTTVVYTVTDKCYELTRHTATFTITPAPAVVANGPENSTSSACSYADQDAVNAAFNAWLSGFTVSGGCSPVGSYGQPVAPAACGGQTTVTYNVSDKCYAGTTITRTFTITPAPAVVVTQAQDSNSSACSYADQAAADAAFNAWLAGFTVSGGCSPVGSFGEGQPSAPNACGGSRTVTYTVTDKCYQSTSYTATFTITAPAPVVINANSVTHTSCEYADQAALDAAFTAWLNTFTVSGGCAPTGSVQGTPHAPALCTGGSVCVTYLVADKCYAGGSITKTFTLTHGESVDVTGPANSTSSSCSYADQAAADAAFAAWLAQFQTVNDGCGATAHFNTTEYQAPRICVGGTVTLTYSIHDNCSQDSVTASFTITPTPQVVFTCGNDVTVPACSTQAQVNTAWNAFLASTTASGGCNNGTLTNNAPANAPLACGGSVNVTWTYNVTGCGTPQSCTRTFTVASAPAVVFNCGNDVTVPACSTQAQVNAAWTAFLNSTTASGGCNGSLTRSQATAPSICGGSTNVTWTYTSSCGQTQTCTKTFTVAAPAPVVLTCGNNVTLPACSTQAQLNAAWTAFLNSTTATGGCNGVLTRSSCSAPSLCGGYVDVTWTYTVASCGAQSGCGNTNSVSCTKRFTVAAPAPVAMQCGSNVTVPACSTQAQVDAAWAAFLASTTATGGCGGVLTNNGGAAPSACGGYKDVTWTYTVGSCGTQSGCGSTNTVTCTKRFTVAAPAPVVFNCGNNVTVASCKTQAQVNAAYASFLASTTASGGCGGVLTNNAPAQAPSACGGYVDVTWTYTVASCGTQSGCGANNSLTCTRRFTVTPTQPVVFNCGSNVTVPACSSQTEVNNAWNAFLASTTASGGCNGVFSRTSPTTPSSCGGSVDVTWTYCSTVCGGQSSTQTCTRTFTVAAPAPVVLTAGNNVTLPACSTQAQLNAAWTAFLNSASATGGCNGVLTRSTCSAPSLCGGYVDVTWTYTVTACGQQSSGCGSTTPATSSQSITRRFTVAAPAPMTISASNNVTVPACSTQADLNAAWTAFLNSATVTGGCNPTITRSSCSAPSLCGGYVDVTWTATTTSCGTQSGCGSTGNSVSITRRFTVAAPSPLTFNAGSNVTLPACSTQAQLNAAWTAFLNSTTVTGGCNPTLTRSTCGAPSLCGGYVDVTWTATTASCGTQSGCGSTGNSVSITRRFTVSAPSPVVFNCGNNVTVSASSTQAQITAAWNAFLASTTASGGCNGMFSRTNPAMPTACGDYADVTWTYTVGSCGAQSGCGSSNSMTCTKRFTIGGGSTAVTINAPSNMTVPSCKTQAQVNALWASFIASATVTGGTGTLTNNASSCTIPSACGGYADVTWTYVDNGCGQVVVSCGGQTTTVGNTYTVTRRFTVQSGGGVNVSGPSSVSYANTSFNSQYAVNNAFACWLAQFTTVSSGCGSTAVFSGDCRVAPSWTYGGTVRVTYSITGACNSDSVCASFTITRGGSTCKTETAIVKNNMTATAYPNPFSESFNIDLKTSNVDKVGVAVYDMTGKLIEQTEINADEVSGFKVGDRYPSGVYNVIVTQGTEVKTLRVIKR